MYDAKRLSEFYSITECVVGKSILENMLLGLL